MFPSVPISAHLLHLRVHENEPELGVGLVDFEKADTVAQGIANRP